MKRSLFFLLSLLLLFVVGCADRKEQMLAQLAELERQTHSGALMTNDTLAESLVRFFDDKGTPNEQMIAHYILGCTYADLGEAPAALDAYLTAVECADTTASDCDYYNLCRVHAQAARQYHRLMQLRSQQEELERAIYYAKKASDTLMVIECFAETAEIYSFLHQPDSVILIREKAANMFTEVGRPKAAARVLGPAISAAVDCNDLQRASRYVEQYESASGLFDDEGNVESGREIYYYTKGRYYLAIGQVDSAEWMFRRLAGSDHSLNEQIGACRGLYEAYLQRRNPDSIAKYANLSYLQNDSAYSLSEMENVQRLKASYNYARHQQIALQEHLKAEKKAAENRTLYILLLVIVVAVGYAARVWQRKRKEAAALMRSKQEELSGLQRELHQIRQQEMELRQLVQTKESITESTTKELDALRQLVEQLSQSIADKEAKEEILSVEIARLQKKREQDREDIDSRLAQSGKYQQYQKKIRKSNKLSAAEFRDMDAMMEDLLPAFHQFVTSKKYLLNENQYRLCLLFRLHADINQAAALLDVSPSYVSRMSHDVLQKMFGEEGNGLLLRKKLGEMSE